jgi:transposase-like protein
MRSTRFENKAGSRRRWSVLEAEAIVGEYGRSGLTQRVFAREIGISVSRLQYWLGRVGRRKGQREGLDCGGGALQKVSLLEVDVEGAGQGGCAMDERYELEWANGMRLRVPRGFGKEELKTLLDLVKEGG